MVQEKGSHFSEWEVKKRIQVADILEVAHNASTYISLAIDYIHQWCWEVESFSWQAKCPLKNQGSFCNERNKEYRISTAAMGEYTQI